MGTRNHTEAVVHPCRHPDMPSHRAPGEFWSSHLRKATEIKKPSREGQSEVSGGGGDNSHRRAQGLSAHQAFPALNHSLSLPPRREAVMGPITETSKLRLRRLKWLV